MKDYFKEEIITLEHVFPGDFFIWYNESSFYIRILIQNEAKSYCFEIVCHTIVRYMPLKSYTRGQYR